jgi:hypothetical protein
MLAPLLLACATVQNVLPGPPVLSEDERAAFEVAAPSPVTYTGPARVPFPVLPAQAWGLRYDLDIVLVSTHPDWTMHEYVRITTPDGPLWLAKDADAKGRQAIVAQLPDIKEWIPEVPVPRYARPLTVEDRSADGRLDLRLAYTNPAGQPVEVTYVGPAPTKPSQPRNGNTMGHSADTLAALLDLHLFRPGGTAEVRIDGKRWPIKRLLGLYPMKFALAQTQAGWAIADYRQRPDEVGFTLIRPSDALVPRFAGEASAPWPTRATEAWTSAGDGWWRGPEAFTRTSWHLNANGEADRVRVDQYGADAPVFEAVFTPALPDLRRPFDGEAVSRFAADVAGQPGHGAGELRARWVDADTVQIDLIPTAPRWFAVRPMRGTVVFDADGTVRTTFTRVPSP